MTMIMQSCLAKETWDRPTAQQLEEYSDAIIKGQPAIVTWTPPSGKIGDSEIISTESDASSYIGEIEEYGLLLSLLLQLLFLLF